MSFKVDVLMEGTHDWIGNIRRFATRDEAVAYSGNLAQRWGAVNKVRIIETTDPVNFEWDPRHRTAVPVRGPR